MRPDADVIPIPDDALEECAREPIHVPGSIQPFGSLLALGPHELDVIFASEDLGARLGVATSSLAGRSIRELGLVPRELVSSLRGLARARRVGVHAHLGSLPVGRPCALVAHWNGVAVVLELVDPGRVLGGARPDDEPTRDERRTAELELRELMGDPGDDLAVLADRIARRMRRLTGYDRVMIYRFDDDDHGEVIAEQVGAGRDSYLGLRYPASDIPAQARRLYLLNRVRQLGDVGARSVRLTSFDRSAPLDLSHAVLRDFSPVHREYLSNMGVRSTLVASIVVAERLWGLLVCHHHEPHWASTESRLVAETCSEVIAGHVALQQAYERERAERRALALRAYLAPKLDRDDVAADVLQIGEELRAVCDADGLVLSVDGRVRTYGETPDPATAARIVAAIAPEPSPSRVQVSGSLVRSCPALAGSLGPFAGAIALHGTWGHALWVRKEQVSHVRWAGRVEKGLVRAPDGRMRLAPRSSFEAWLSEVRGRSRAFDQAAIGVAEWLRGFMTDRELRAVAREREAAERALETSQARLALATAAGRVAIWSFLPGMRLPSVGEDFFALLGHARGPLTERPTRLIDVIHPADVDTVLARFATLSEQRPPSFDVDFRTVDANGDVRWFHAVGSPTRGDDGNVESYLGTFADVTDLRRAADALTDARERAAETDKMRALGQLASGIAHDFNNTLAGIVWNVEEIAEDPATPPQLRSALELVLEAAMRSASTVKELQRFAAAPRPSDGRAARADLREVARSARELTRHRWQNQAAIRGATIDVVIDAPSPVHARIDPAEAQDVLVNLLINAADAIEGRGDVRIHVRAEGGRAVVSVSDDGTGMDPETARRCFEPFFSTKGDRGTGLGLASAWATARRRHGTLEVLTAPGRGSTFTFSIPLAEADDSHAVEGRGARTLTGRVIAVVDDEPVVRGSLVQLLARIGAEVHPFDGGRALLHALHGGSHFDAVVTDLGMPGLDGRALASRVSALRPAVPVVLLTGWGEQLDLEHEREHGIRAVLAKPATFSDVRRCLEGLLLPVS